MPDTHISSRSNDNIKYIKKLLSSSKFRRENGCFVLEGLRLCMDAVQNGYKPLAVYYTKAAKEKSGADIAKIVSAADKSYSVSNDVFSAISDTVSPQGVICVMRVSNQKCSIATGGKYIVLHNLSTPDNVGAISRSAEAFGLDGIITLGGCDIFNPKALRASMGALLRLPVYNMTECEFFDVCKQYGITTYASTPRDSASTLGSIDFAGGCAVVIGNEANGLPDDFISRCDAAVTIPMHGKAESLNAAAAAAVLIYEMTKSD